MKKRRRKYSSPILFLLAFISLSGNLSAQAPPQLTLKMDQARIPVSPRLYGLMTEEINHSYDGGLYAELIRNGIFKDNPKNPDHWSIMEGAGGEVTMALDKTQPINDAL